MNPETINRTATTETTPGILINCRERDFIEDILTRAKPYETRPSDTLRALVGKKHIALIQTRHIHARIVRGYVDIVGSEVISYDNIEARKSAKIYGTSYDIKPGQTKVFYKLENVTPCDWIILDRSRCINHGRSYTEYT